MTNPSEQKPAVAPAAQPQQNQATPAPQPQQNQGDAKPGTEKPAQQS